MILKDKHIHFLNWLAFELRTPETDIAFSELWDIYEFTFKDEFQEYIGVTHRTIGISDITTWIDNVIINGQYTNEEAIFLNRVRELFINEYLNEKNEWQSQV